MYRMQVNYLNAQLSQQLRLQPDIYNSISYILHSRHYMYASNAMFGMQVSYVCTQL
jgi:hypothetical protein